MNQKIRYKRFIERIRQTYGISKKMAEDALFNAYVDFLSIDELEQFIIPLKERKLNIKFTQSKGGKNNVRTRYIN